MVKPVEYMYLTKRREAASNMFQYCSPCCKLNKKDIQEKVFKTVRNSESDFSSRYESFYDGSHFRENDFLSLKRFP